MINARASSQARARSDRYPLKQTPISAAVHLRTGPLDGQEQVTSSKVCANSWREIMPHTVLLTWSGSYSQTAGRMALMLTFQRYFVTLWNLWISVMKRERDGKTQWCQGNKHLEGRRPVGWSALFYSVPRKIKGANVSSLFRYIRYNEVWTVPKKFIWVSQSQEHNKIDASGPI